MARVPQNREKRVVHTCPICGRESPPHDGAMHRATDYLLQMGWSWTSQLEGGEWHLVCQKHRKRGEPRTLYYHRGDKYNSEEPWDPEKHDQHAL